MLIYLQENLTNINQLVEMNAALRAAEKITDHITRSALKTRMKNYILSSKYKVFLLKFHEYAIGYLVVKALKRNNQVCQMFIAQEFRGQGFGSKAIAEIRQLLGRSELLVEVLAENKAAIHFYRKNNLQTVILGYETIQ